MDLIRSCYQTLMRFEPGGPLIPVRWYRAKPDALAFPGPHSFFSYDSEDDQTNSDLGEQRPPRGQWDAGMRPAALRGNGHFEGTALAFLDGIAGLPLDAEEVDVIAEPELCVCPPFPHYLPVGPPDSDFRWHQTCGGIRWTVNAEAVKFPRPAPQLCDDGLDYATFQVGASTFPIISGPLNDAVWNGVDPDHAFWEGDGTLNLITGPPAAITYKIWQVGLDLVAEVTFVGGRTNDSNIPDPVQCGPFVCFPGVVFDPPSPPEFPFGSGILLTLILP